LLRKSAQRRGRTLYTPGELNRIIDALVHPLIEHDPYLIVLDGILHSLIEMDPSGSLAKFLQYSSPKLLAELIRKRDRKKRSGR